MMKSDDLTHCARLARKHDYGRYLGALAAPAGQRDMLFVLLAFNDELGRIRDIVSEPGLGDIRLAWWRELILSDADNAGAHPVARAIRGLLDQGAVSKDKLSAMIDGRARDLDPDPFQSVEDVVDHARQTAGRLSLAALEVLGVSDSDSSECATDVAIAWGLTGLLRSMPHHEQAGRPMLGKSVPPGDLLDRADDALISARGRARKISQQAMPVLYPARICDLWLARFRACGADPWKVDLAMAPVTPVWRILTGRILGRF